MGIGLMAEINYFRHTYLIILMVKRNHYTSLHIGIRLFYFFLPFRGFLTYVKAWNDIWCLGKKGYL